VVAVARLAAGGASVLTAVDPQWLAQIAERYRAHGITALELRGPTGRVVFQRGTGPTKVGAWIFPGALEVAVARDLPEATVWGEAAVMATLLAAVALLLSTAMLLRRRAARLELASRERERRLAQLASASERLSRLRDPAEVAARAATLARTLLGCDEAHVALGRDAPDQPATRDSGESQSVTLTGSNGERLGRITVRRTDATNFSAEDEMVLDQVSRAVAAALEGANLLADAVQAKSEVELILSTISDGMFVLDRHWCVRYVNNAALRYLRRVREEMLGVTLWEVFPGLRETEFGERFEFARSTAQDVDFSAFYAPMSAWYEVRCYPFAGGLTVYFRDVSAQRETAEKLRQSQKLESLGQLTGGIAHDVNNLLTVILGNFEMLAMNAEDRGGVAASDLDLAEAGLRAGESASQLMHRLLAFSRRQPLSPRVVNVAELLSSLEPLLRRTLGEHVNIQIDWQPALWRALVDPAELENAILNLAINARDSMGSGGKLLIEAANVEIDRVYAAVAGLDRTGDFIMVSVADSGTGMSREVLGKAFDPFFTTKQQGQGTGLGLSMVHGFANQSGGHVMIDSEIGQGTIVRLYLPRTAGEDAPLDAMPDREVSGGDETILLVEDNDLVRTHTESMLRGLGYRVIAAADGPEALLLLREGLRPDLLLTDVVLPLGMTGRDVADAAARLVGGLRVLFTSGYSGDVLLENGRVSPGVELMSKPFRRAELARRIRARMSSPAWTVIGAAIEPDRGTAPSGL
jgi:signal transduction histidine kinase